MRSIAYLGLLIALMSAWCVERTAAQAVGAKDTQAYSFGNYPISTIYRGKVAFPDFRGRDRDASVFRTRIVNAMREGPNFAGKYAVIQIGCGTGCRFYPVVDVTTGSVKSFPLGGEEYLHLDLHFRIDSALIVAVWDDGEKCLQEAFKMERGSLNSLGRSAIPGDPLECKPEAELE